MRDKLFVHLEKDETHAIVCISQTEAQAASADDPQSYQEVWRDGRIFVGMRVDLAKVSQARVQELVEHAWRHKAPKRLVAEYDRG